MKVYARYRDVTDLPQNSNIASAVYGFHNMGFEVISYYNLSEIYDIVTEEDIIVDGIMQVNSVMEKFGVDVSLCDYPKELGQFLGRTIWTDTMDNINRNPDKWGIFVKPFKPKAFTGRVIREPKDLIGCGSCYENYDVYCSEVMDIKREYRVYIVYDEIVEIRAYKGDYHYHIDSSVLDTFMNVFKTWKDRPMGCGIDFAVVSDNQGGYKTVLLEVNDGYSLGNYGVRNTIYAKLISARWSQLLNRVDECKF